MVLGGLIGGVVCKWIGVELCWVGWWVGCYGLFDSVCCIVDLYLFEIDICRLNYILLLFELLVCYLMVGVFGMCMGICVVIGLGFCGYWIVFVWCGFGYFDFGGKYECFVCCCMFEFVVVCCCGMGVIVVWVFFVVCW